MCNITPLTVKSIHGSTVVMENGVKAHYNPVVGDLKPGDTVTVFGNVIIEKTERYTYEERSP